MGEQTVEKDFSPEFQRELLDLAIMCVESGTDSCTISFEYEHAIWETDLTFRARKKV